MSLFARTRSLLATIRRRRADLVGINQRNVTLVYPNNPRRHFPIADDKLLAKTYLERAGVPVAPTLAVCEGLFAVRKTAAALREREHFVVKPASGSGGAGILVVGGRTGDGTWQRAGGEELTVAQLQKHLADVIFGAFSNQLEDKAFVEERVVPHPYFSGLWADGLCDIRVITLRAEPLMAMIRVPTTESEGRANLHQGGLGIAVDLASGRAVRAVHRRQPIEVHPENGMRLLGDQVPCWPEILDAARRAAGAVPLGYLGVDLVVDQHRGPLVLEINVRPGLEIQNVNGRGLGPELRRVA